MLIQFLILIALCLILYFLTNHTSITVYRIAFRITRNKTVTIGIVAALFLPGTILHELSHFFFALILRVRTGKLTIFPTVSESGEVKAGSLEIARPDPFRHTLIGLAPMIVGLTATYFIGEYFFPHISLIITASYRTLLGLYCLWMITSTMFTSKRDLQAFLFVGPILFLILLSLYLSGIRLSLTETASVQIESFLVLLNQTLGVASGIQLTVFILFQILLKITQRLIKS